MAISNDRFVRHEIDLLDRLVQHLDALIRRAEEACKTYKRQLEAAANSGFMTNYTDNLGGEKFVQLTRHIDRLSEVRVRCTREIALHKSVIKETDDAAKRY